MATINVEISDGLLADLDALYKARYQDQDDHDSVAKKTSYISKVMTYELQEILKQYKREVAVASANQEIVTSPDFVKTEFEQELETKASALSPQEVK